MPALISPKSARLAAECTAAAELSSPCQPGQKWHCVREAGRWRKHKCKYQTVLQSHLDTMRKTYPQRKCACFTPAGLVYRRIADPISRYKRDIEENAEDSEDHLDKLLQNYPNVFDFHSRTKRDTFDHVTSIMKGIQEEIFDLETSDEKFDNSSALSREAKCNVASNGIVNCTDLIYEDPKAWKNSRLKIEKQIRKLRDQLLELKEIRRHLKLKKPQWVLEHDAISEESDDFEEDISIDSEITEEPVYESKFVHRKVKHHDKSNSKRQKHKHKHEKLGGTEIFNNGNSQATTVFEDLTTDARHEQISSTTEEPISSSTMPTTSRRPTMRRTKPTIGSTTEKYNITIISENPSVMRTFGHKIDGLRRTTKLPTSENAPKSKLGPARIDVLMFSHSKGNFGANRSDSNSRLGPLHFSDNEDKHVCYCNPDK